MQGRYAGQMQSRCRGCRYGDAEVWWCCIGGGAEVLQISAPVHMQSRLRSSHAKVQRGRRCRCSSDQRQVAGDTTNLLPGCCAVRKRK